MYHWGDENDSYCFDATFTGQSTATIKQNGVVKGTVGSGWTNWDGAPDNSRLEKASFKLSKSTIDKVTVDWTYTVKRVVLSDSEYSAIKQKYPQYEPFATEVRNTNIKALTYVGVYFTRSSNLRIVGKTINVTGYKSYVNAGLEADDKIEYIKSISKSGTVAIGESLVYTIDETTGMRVSDYVSLGDKDVDLCGGFVFNTEITNRANTPDSVEAFGGSGYSEFNDAYAFACVSFSYPYALTVASTPATSDAYIGEQTTVRHKIDVSESVDTLPDGGVSYYTVYFFTGVDGKNTDGSATFSDGSGYGRRALSLSTDATTRKNEICARLSINSGAGGTGCTVYASGSVSTGSVEKSVNVNVPDSSAYIGAKICAVAVHNYWSANSDGSGEFYPSDADTWGTSEVTCSPIYKKPNFRVTGGPVFAEGTITTSLSSKTATDFATVGKSYGSWAEYLVSGNSGISLGFASGAASSAGTSESSSSLKFSPLTIANTNLTSSKLSCGGSIYVNGCAGIDSGAWLTVQKIASYVEVLQSKVNMTTQTVGGVSMRCVADFYICFYAGTGTVTISSDLVAPDGFPMIVIYTTGNIKIASGVTYVDAWLIAGGNVYTCDGKSDASSLSVSTCAEALTINGAVYANGIYLMRTAGADGSSSSSSGDEATRDAESAETINFDAAAYVWAHEVSTSGSLTKLTEVYSSELAPRY